MALPPTKSRSTSYSPRIRRAFVTIGNLLIGQTQQLTYDPFTNVGSIDNNSFMGQEAGNRWSQIQYHWDIAQNSKFFVAVEQPYSDAADVAGPIREISGLAAILASKPTPTTAIPDLSAKFTTDQSWGRFFAAGTLRNITINTEGLDKVYGANATQAVNADVWGGFVDAGIKINLPFLSTSASTKDGLGQDGRPFCQRQLG